jgi:hypothetical protein
MRHEPHGYGLSWIRILADPDPHIIIRALINVLEGFHDCFLFICNLLGFFPLKSLKATTNGEVKNVIFAQVFLHTVDCR